MGEAGVSPSSSKEAAARGERVKDDRAEAYTCESADGLAASGVNGRGRGIEGCDVVSGDRGAALCAVCELITNNVECGP